PLPHTNRRPRRLLPADLAGRGVGVVLEHHGRAVSGATGIPAGGVRATRHRDAMLGATGGARLRHVRRGFWTFAHRRTWATAAGTGRGAGYRGETGRRQPAPPLRPS